MYARPFRAFTLMHVYVASPASRVCESPCLFSRMYLVHHVYTSCLYVIQPLTAMYILIKYLSKLLCTACRDNIKACYPNQGFYMVSRRWI